MADRTKIWIAEKMKKLMVRKPIDKIRVSEICKEAGIERPTFYYHFKDKYDLIAWIIFHSTFDTEITNAAAMAYNLKQLKQDSAFYKRVFEDTSQIPAWQYILTYIETLFKEKILAQTGLETLDEQTIYNVHAHCYAGIHIMHEWLNDPKTPAEVIAERMINSLPDSLKSLFQTKESTV